MRPLLINLLSSAALFCAAATTASATDSRALQSACFAPNVLKGIPGEKFPSKGDRDFDGVPREAETLAPSQPIEQAMRGAIRRVELPKGEKLIALTFDLCEQHGEVAGYDGEVIDYLRRENVKATLFAGGKWMRSHQARTEQLMTDPLFEMGNHSDTHPNLRKLDGPALQTEVLGPQRAYRATVQRLSSTQCAAKAPEAVRALAPRLTLFRFPFGACNAASMNAVNDAGLLAIQWDLSTGDPDPHQTSEAIASAMVHNARPGSIIISHANGRGWNTAAALPLAIPKLKAMGYTFVTVSELLARGKPVITETCYDNHPGDTDRYDFLGSMKPGAKAATGSWVPTLALPWATHSDMPTPTNRTSAPPKDTHKNESTGLSWPF